MIMKKIIVGFVCGFMLIANVLAGVAYGPTTSSDTVWNIAAKLRPSENVSISQVVLGIFRFNKKAFYENNINALADGKTIKCPDIDFIKVINEAEADRTIVEQNRVWQEMLSAKSSMPKNVPIPIPSIPAETNAAVVNSAVKDIAQVQSQLGSGEVVSAVQQSQLPAEEVTIKSLTDRLVESEVKNSVAQTQIIQLNERVSSLEKNISELVSSAEQKKEKGFVGNILGSVQKYADQLSGYLGPQVFMIVVVGTIIVLLFLLVYLIRPRREEVAADYPKDGSSVKQDADFDPMSDGEGMASKLNLARAYIEMGQESKAQAMLYEVLSHGDDNEQAEAKVLLETMKGEEDTGISW